MLPDLSPRDIETLTLKWLLAQFKGSSKTTLAKVTKGFTVYRVPVYETVYGFRVRLSEIVDIELNRFRLEIGVTGAAGYSVKADTLVYWLDDMPGQLTNKQ